MSFGLFKKFHTQGTLILVGEGYYNPAEDTVIVFFTLPRELLDIFG